MTRVFCHATKRGKLKIWIKTTKVQLKDGVNMEQRAFSMAGKLLGKHLGF